MNVKILKLTTLSLLLSASFIINNANAGVIENGLGGTAGFGEHSLASNDDSSSAFIDLTSVFTSDLNFFGTNYTGLYVNNNGNVTFSNALSQFTPNSLTDSTNNPMIAPFFADVDTRGGSSVATPGGNSTGSNMVYWDLDSINNVFTVTWDDVGYFSSQTDLLNAFQLQLIDMGNGDFDISITYETINWTTGGASGGNGGLGGTVARGGWNSGNGTDYQEFSWSGNQSQALNLGNTNGNLIQVRNGNVVQSVPEPSTLAIFALGIMGLASRRFAKK